MAKFAILVDDDRFDGQALPIREQENLVKEMLEEGIYFDEKRPASVTVVHIADDVGITLLRNRLVAA
jgi:hypothetical protein